MIRDVNGVGLRQLVPSNDGSANWNWRGRGRGRDALATSSGRLQNDAVPKNANGWPFWGFFAHQRHLAPSSAIGNDQRKGECCQRLAVDGRVLGSLSIGCTCVSRVIVSIKFVTSLGSFVSAVRT